MSRTYRALLRLVGVVLGNVTSGDTTDTVDVGLQLSKSFGSIPVNLLVGRALGLIDGITKRLDPELDTLEIIQNSLSIEVVTWA